ncbi:MAG: zf-HC2 domain-containing protein [Clostridia bacterium]|nr:zf-HC2 domain-containing protein [Clostridia bacterium]
MTCLECQKKFSLFRDHQLSSQQITNLEAHLQSCPHCQKQWQDWQRKLDLLHNLSGLSAPSTLAQLVHQQIRQNDCQKLSRLSRIWTPKIWFAALGLAAILLVSFFTLQNSGINPKEMASKQSNSSHTLALSDSNSSEWKVSSTSRTYALTGNAYPIPHITLQVNDSREEILQEIEHQVEFYQGEYQEIDPEGCLWLRLNPENWDDLVWHLDSLSSSEKQDLLLSQDLKYNEIILELVDSTSRQH